MPLTIVMYHYVRRIAESRHPQIKGLERDLFVQQLEYIKRHYVPVTGEQVIDAIRGGETLPDRAVLLTFDDGYLDHFTTVVPILRRARMSGIFFPPARCVLERQMLDVNKIHFILASTPDTASLVSMIDAAVEAAPAEIGLESLQAYREKYAMASRFDSAEVIYIKRMLQVGLPKAVRSSLVDAMFARVVSNDPVAFAHEVYMDEDQVRCLVDCGMMVGSHGYSHEWLDSQTPQEQAREIDLSMSFLERVGVDLRRWAMCYPYGVWTDAVLSYLRTRGCAVGFTTEVDLADLTSNDPLLLPRLDTNDLPKNADAEPNRWTRLVL